MMPELIEAAERNELILWANSMCRYYLRKDGRLTIRELFVLPEARRRKAGLRMIMELRRRHPEVLMMARCPKKYESNTFWKAIGFELVEADEINVWVLPSSTALKGTAISA